MCGLKAAQIHVRPFRAAEDHVQPSTALDLFLPNGKKILIWLHLSTLPPGYLRQLCWIKDAVSLECN